MIMYFSDLIISWSILFIVFIIISSNIGIDRNQRCIFYTIIIFIFITSSCECIGNVLNGTHSSIFLHYVIKIIELSLTPILAFYSNKLFIIKDETKFEIIFEKILIFLLVLHTLIKISNIKFGLIFYIDNKNIYIHGKFYSIYIFMCAINAAYFIHKISRFSKYYQNVNNLLTLISTFLFSGESFSFFSNSNIKISWIILSITLLFIYTYYNELIMYTDNLTGVLNQNYFNCLKNLKGQYILIIFDIDDFKSINDTYGHEFGNKVLNIVGKIIKDTYCNYGHCYRIGGDEFAVLINKKLSKNDLLELNSHFIDSLQIYRNDFPKLPYVSFGSTLYDSDIQSLESAKVEADKDMYKYKKSSKIAR